MKKSVFPLLIMLFVFVGAAMAQDSSLHPFLGVSGNYLGISRAGWGVELGARYGDFYLGAEYGNFGYAEDDPSQAQQTFPIADGMYGDLELGAIREDPHFSISREHYLSLTGGIIVANRFWLGYSAIVSDQNYIHPVLDFTGQYYTWEKVTSYYFDIGPDVRIEAWNHLLFNFSYSYRRGIKSGFAYIL